MTDTPRRTLTVPPMAQWVPGTTLPALTSTDTEYDREDRS
jgi:hypothetical protein